jgi:hypothetical protein
MKTQALRPRILAAALGLISFSLSARPLLAEDLSGVVAFCEPGFPAADSASPSPRQLQALLPGVRLAPQARLEALLDSAATRLLVLPYGSAFPEDAWPAIERFLRRGGDLLVLGGRPFSRAAYRGDSGWRLRDYSVRFMRPLLIDQYQATPGSEGLDFVANPETAPPLPRFSWQRAFSPIIRLSSVDLDKRCGASGSLDARLDALAWGVKDGRKLAAPALQVDHLKNGFNGGRWVFLNAELAPGFYAGPAAELVRCLAQRALRSSEEFTVRPALPLYLPGESVPLDISWRTARPPRGPVVAKIAVFPEQQPRQRLVLTATAPFTQPLVLPPPSGAGLHVVEAQLWDGDALQASYHSGFWMRDAAYLRSGPRLSVNSDYFELDGRPMAVVGTTHMSSETQRLYFEHPNVYVWDRDLAQIQAAGLNMIRTGWWTGWDKFCDRDGRPNERTLRTVEAYLMTARKHGLPVQFNLFAFLPEVLGGVNAYLDAEAVSRQRTLIAAMAARFHDVPFLAWDLINEPSISQHLWTMRPNGDAVELRKWNEWLGRRYPDRAALAAAWNLPADAVAATAPLPEPGEFEPRGVYDGRNSLKVYDFFLFAQETFAGWARGLRDAVRAAGSRQLVTVGQDEGGILDRPAPAFWGESADFTNNHSWWHNDDLLWDSLLAKQPGKALLIQETGLQRELNADETARRTPESEAALLARKVAMAFVQGAGAIQWLWHTNSAMTSSNEAAIGALRADGTEKPEATVMRDYAGFARRIQGHLRGPRRPDIAVITSQAAQFSVLSDLQLQAQRRAIRALAYADRLTAYAVAENQIGNLGRPPLAILPSPQALTQKAWGALIAYVKDGGNLLITGPVDRDEHWQRVPRAAEVGLDAEVEPLIYHDASIDLGGRAVPLSFDPQKQDLAEALRFRDGSTLKELSCGRGRIFWLAYPVELAEQTPAAAAVYAHVAGRLGLAPLFELQTPLAAGVLVYPLVLEDAVLYVMVSESAEDATVDLRDRTTGARLTIPLPRQRAALALIGMKEKAVLARSGF